MSTTEPNDPLERLLDRTLRELPLRHAPLTLESRVFGELERRAARPWWRRSFAHWPLYARGVFLAICGVLVWLTFLGGAAAVDGVHSLPWAQQAGVLMLSVGNFAGLLTRLAPPTWLYAGIAVCAVLYAVLFGLGAVGYRTLYLQSTAGDSLT
jgi:hypothetical protein